MADQLFQPGIQGAVAAGHLPNNQDTCRLARMTIKAKSNVLSRMLATIEEEHLDVGIEFFARLSRGCIESTSDDERTLRSAFLVFNDIPKQVNSLVQARALKEQALLDIRQGDAVGAREKLIMLEDYLGEVGAAMQEISTAQGEGDWPRDSGWDDSEPELPTRDGQPELYEKLRRWVMTLPETRKAIELGIDEEGAVAQALSRDQDRVSRRSDPPFEYGSWPPGWGPPIPGGWWNSNGPVDVGNEGSIRASVDVERIRYDRAKTRFDHPSGGLEGAWSFR